MNPEYAHFYSAPEFWYSLAAGFCIGVAWAVRRHYRTLERNEAIAHRYAPED